MAVQKVDNSSINYPGSILIGGLTGYCFKWALPIMPQEKDAKFKSELKQVRVRVKSYIANEIEAIRRNSHGDEATDVFLRLYNEKHLNEAQLKTVPEHLLAKVREFKESIICKTKDAVSKGRADLITLTKKIRPTSIFVLTGMALGLATALTINEINSISSHKIDKSNYA